MPETGPGSPLAGLGSFLSKHGLATLIAVFFLWWVYEDRQAGISAAALQMKDMNGQILHMSGLLSAHHEEAKKSSTEVSRILLAACLNQADSAPLDQQQGRRDRCMGW